MDEKDDPVLQMFGVGKEIWSDTTADDYVRALRANWFGDEAEVGDDEKPKDY
jgi:hypothetical protein